jgi:hypothetical protein
MSDHCKTAFGNRIPAIGFNGVVLTPNCGAVLFHFCDLITNAQVCWNPNRNIQFNQAACFNCSKKDMPSAHICITYGFLTDKPIDLTFSCLRL